MKMKRWASFVAVLTLALTTACGGGASTSTPAPSQPKEQGSEQKPAEKPAEKPADSGKKQEMILGTGSTGGTYYPLGGEIAALWSKNVEGVNVTSTASAASIENLAKIGSGEFDLGMTVHLPARDAVNGEGEFAGHKITNFGFIGHVYPEVLQILVREESGINTIADLKGKRIAVGPGGSATAVLSKIILEAYGVKEGEYEAFSEGFGAAKDRVQDGTIDASFGILGVPASSIAELNAATKDAKILEITGPELDQIVEKSGYGAFTIPAGTYEWINKDIHTISAYAIMVASLDKVSEEQAYNLTKTMIEKSGEVTHAQAKYMTKENALNGSDGLPFHPGAEKYYKEIGLIK